jgi:RimJ/RimL family protein N-acetyltransferase
MAILPIETERLSVRMMRAADAPTLAAYRADPDVARYQSWELPYTLTAAEALVAGQAHLDDVTPGDWVQLAIEHAGAVVGDVAVGLDAQGAEATIGYTLAPDRRGLGLAAEAVAAVVDALFDRGGVRRIVAATDPANQLSMRVIEPLGFHFEGIARGAAPVRGEWLDDARFALLREERRTWVARQETRAADVRLAVPESEHLNGLLALATHRFQEPFVSPIPRSLAQILVPPFVQGNQVTPWWRVVIADDEVAGFVLLSAVNDWEPEPYLWRFLIDRSQQRRGVGSRAIVALAAHLRADGHEAMRVSWVEGAGGPRPFYERLGFQAVGITDEGETEGRLVLADLRVSG